MTGGILLITGAALLGIFTSQIGFGPIETITLVLAVICIAGGVKNVGAN